MNKSYNRVSSIINANIRLNKDNKGNNRDIDSVGNWGLGDMLYF